MKRWEAARRADQAFPPGRLAGGVEFGGANRFIHIWAYKTMDQRLPMREKGARPGVWPPPGGGDELLARRPRSSCPRRSRRCSRETPMPPTKLAHLVFQTNRLPAMRDWYCTVLDGHVISHENPHLSFVTYDDEHHRVAFIDFGPLAAREAGGSDLRYRATGPAGLHHVAFTFGSMGELLDNYERLRRAGHPPVPLHQPWADHLDVLPSIPTATAWSCRSTTSPPRRKGRPGCTRPPSTGPDRRRVRPRRPGEPLPGRRPGRRARHPRLGRGQVLHSDISRSRRPRAAAVLVAAPLHSASAR